MPAVAYAERMAALCRELPELQDILQTCMGPLAGRIRDSARKHAEAINEATVTYGLKHVRFYYGLMTGKYRLHTCVGQRLPERVEDLIGDHERSVVFCKDESNSSFHEVPPMWMLHHSRKIGRHEGFADLDYVSLQSWLEAHPGAAPKEHPYYGLLAKMKSAGMGDWPLYGYFWRPASYKDGEMFLAGPACLTDLEVRNLCAFLEIGQHI